MLLHFAGEWVYRIFKTLPNTGEPKDFEKSSRETYSLKEYEPYMFRQAQQDSVKLYMPFINAEELITDMPVSSGRFRNHNTIKGCPSEDQRRGILRVHNKIT